MSAQALKALQAKRATIKSLCTRTRTSIEAMNPQDVNIASLKQRKEKFTEYWSQFIEIQAQIDEILAAAIDLPNLEELKIEQDTEYVNFEENYFTIAGKIECLLTPAYGNTNHVTANVDQAPIASTEGYVRDLSQVHLPKIAIPKFSDDYQEWYPFYNTFQSIVHNNTNLTNIQRFHYLISSLEGDAAHIIQSIKITPENYQEAMTLLKQRYDDKRVIIQERVKALYDLSIVAKENYVALRKLVDNVLRHLRSLKSLGRPTDTWDDLIIHLIVARLNPSLVSE
ncbi:uncharacterized protein LOC118645800 [Monomorium pharaonis]|uniref:uncharacterized protein LOC118645800 n=1 Tax=Monomorium pharaonis TaxID=307658 RepID=UPI001746688B|nr:uncharacterized protein LOC118645800 [Monomorium pharaonis]